MAKLHFNSHVFDFALHPSNHIAVAGLITGDIEWYGILQSFLGSFPFSYSVCLQYSYRFGQDHSQRQWGIKPTKKSCRGVEFSQDGKCKYLVFEY